MSSTSQTKPSQSSTNASQQNQKFNFKEQFNKYLKKEFQMEVQNSVERVHLINNLVKQFTQTDKETKKMILDYYKSKDYLNKYLTADGAERAEVSTQAIQFIKQSLTNEDDITIRTMGLIGRLTKMKACQMHTVPVSFVDMDIELPEINDDIVFQTILWKHIGLFAYYVPDFKTKFVLSEEEKQNVLQKFMLISEPHRVQAIINTFPDYVKTYPVIHKMQDQQLRQDYYNYFIVCRMQEFKTLLQLLLNCPKEFAQKVINQQTELYQEFPTIILDLVLDIQLYYLKHEIYRRIVLQKHSMNENLFKSMLKDNHDPRKYALFRQFMQKNKSKAESQQQDFEKIVDILTYETFN